MLDVICTHCGKTLKIPEEYLGQKGKCNHCQGEITVMVAPLKFSTEAIQAEAELNHEEAVRDSPQRLDGSPEAIIPYKCPMCGTLLHIPERCAGQRVRCTTCNAMIIVPSVLNDEEPPQTPHSAGAVLPTVSVPATFVTREELTPVRSSVQYLETRPHYADAQPLDQRPLYMGLAGAVLLFAGTFAPLLKVPILGNVNYIGNGRGDGVIIAIIAAIALIMTLNRQFRYLYVLGLTALGVMGVTFVLFQVKVNEAKQQLHTDLQGNPFAGIGEGMINLVQLGWGWAVLIAGAVLIIAASALHPKWQ